MYRTNAYQSIRNPWWKFWVKSKAAQSYSLEFDVKAAKEVFNNSQEVLKDSEEIKEALALAQVMIRDAAAAGRTSITFEPFPHKKEPTKRTVFIGCLRKLGFEVEGTQPIDTIRGWN